MFSLLTEDYRYGDGLDNAWMKTTIVERDKYGGGSVMVWGGILFSHSGKTELVTVNGRLNARRYCDEIIIPVVIPVLQRESAKQRSLPCCTSHNVQPFYSRATFRHSTGLCM